MDNKSNQGALMMKKMGRNDLCACGSGKKYKNCCMAKELLHASANQQEAQWIASAIETAITHHQQGQQKEAQEIYEAILQIEPDHAHALHFLGVIAYQNKQYPIAEDLMSRSIAANPLVAMYYCNYGMLLKDLGKFAQAVENHRKALALQADYAEAHLNLGVALFNLELYDEASESFRKTIQLQPGSAKAFDNLGTVLRCQYDFANAIQCYQRALELDPNYVISYSNLAATYIEVKNFPMASSYCLKAIALDQNCADAYMYLGIACQEQGDLAGAEKFLHHAAALAPQNFNTHWNISITMLALGKLDQGWKGYEFRWIRGTGPVKQHHFPYPWWQGEVMPDKTILIWGEQGIGDEIMFANMIEDLIPRFKQCIIACNKKLLPLFSRSFPAAKIVAINDVQQLSELSNVIDVQSAAGSLARWLRPTIASFPKKTHYLEPNADRVADWKERLAALGPELTVGICWRSGNMVGNRPLYCTQLDQWGPIFATPGVRFINLQYDECSAELEAAKHAFGIEIHSFAEVDLFNDLDEAAALTKALDLVISAPTSAAILAAALGVPTWMMISGFEWQTLGTSEICWYSTARIFHKPWEQEWDTVIANVATQLQLKRVEGSS
ncbi:tetratricopeptide repeat protein [Solimicrobium silvestre]|uniref:TPR repeat n=1 Tax=Solimicrobium silvestre TaxID=2099400 RepID=A0A2S9GV04_9BURK|nr:tetratricopeptide repeat protein [Solimicrobium silvestre]PRC91486.1 TPR repeat [Solimicrobium silvestre]